MRANKILNVDLYIVGFIYGSCSLLACHKLKRAKSSAVNEQLPDALGGDTRVEEVILI